MQGYLVAGKTGSIDQDDGVIVLRLHFRKEGGLGMLCVNLLLSLRKAFSLRHMD
jgi:hypothetical protein